MSTRRPNLSGPPVVIGVLVVLAVLIAVNVRTFAPLRGRSRPDAEVRVQAHPSLPMDLEEILLQAGRPAGDLGVPVNGPRPELQRDPFASGPLAPEPMSVSAAPLPKTARSGALYCSAVMLSSGAPAALIDGRLVHVGDLVRRHTVDRIDARGVSLGGESRLFLPVGVASAGEGTNVVVTGAVSGDRLGSTSLVEHADSERK